MPVQRLPIYDTIVLYAIFQIVCMYGYCIIPYILHKNAIYYTSAKFGTQRSKPFRCQIQNDNRIPGPELKVVTLVINR